VVSKERHYERVDVKDAGANRKSLEDMLGAADTSNRFLVGTLEDLR
jgi:hypothetical protein